MSTKPRLETSWLTLAFLMAAGLLVLWFWTAPGLTALWLTSLPICG